MIESRSLSYLRPLGTLAALLCLSFVLHADVCAQTARAHPTSAPPRTDARNLMSARRKRLNPDAQKIYRQRLEQAVSAQAARFRIDPLLIWALLEQESGGGKQFAYSPKGASGPMQLMPATAARWGVKNPTDPVEAVRGGTEYLVWLIDRYGGDVRLGLAGYNAGEGAVDRYGRRIPPYRETQNYVLAIEGRYLRLCRERRGQGAVSALVATAAAQTAPPVVVESYSYRFRLPASAPPAANPGVLAQTTNDLP